MTHKIEKSVQSLIWVQDEIPQYEEGVKQRGLPCRGGSKEHRDWSQLDMTICDAAKILDAELREHGRPRVLEYSFAVLAIARTIACRAAAGT